MKKVTITAQIIFLIAMSLIGLCITNFIGLSAAKNAEAQIVEIKTNILESIDVLNNANNAFHELQVLVYQHGLSTNELDKTKIESEMASITQTLQKQLSDYKSLLVTKKDGDLLDAENASTNAYIQAFHNQLKTVSRAQDTEHLLTLLTTEMKTLANKANADIKAHIDYNQELATNYTEASIKQVDTTTQLAIGIVLATLAGLVFLGVWILSNIRGSLSLIKNKISHIESNLDFTQRIEILREDEIGTTTQALNRLLDKVQNSLKNLHTNSERVANSANQVATTSDQVAIAARQQNESAANMAATVEEMTVSISHVGDRAHDANRLSSESGQLASTGEAIIIKTVSDINEIASTVNEAAERIKELVNNSQQISTVIAVIREVADRTNLLALNAAIEAARAGEQGRGFAVVADEVRKLAERTASSTLEISKTIETMHVGANEVANSMASVEHKVHLGVESAQKANEAINQIRSASKNAVKMVEEIAAAIQEQASAMTTLAQQVESIAQMSEESSVAVSNTAQTANDLDKLAHNMQETITAYHL